MIEKLTKQEIGQIRQEIKSLENEQREKRGGLRVSQVDRQIATNEVAKSYGMTGIELARMVAGKSWRVAKSEKEAAVAATAQSLIEQMSQKHAAELEALRLEIANIEKRGTKATVNDGFFKGKYVCVYSGSTAKPNSVRVVSRGKAIHVGYFDDVKQANKIAENIERLVEKAIEAIAGDA